MQKANRYHDLTNKELAHIINNLINDGHAIEQIIRTSKFSVEDDIITTSRANYLILCSLTDVVDKKLGIYILEENGDTKSWE